MTRSKRFIYGTLAGYGSISANIVFTIASVPLALAFLSKNEFGLWALAAQITGYLGLLELGMGNAVNRHIADHKDHVNGGQYGSHLLTGGLVYLSQAAIIAATGIGLSCFAPNLFSIPHHLSSEFRLLVALMATISGLSIATRSAGVALWAFQRMDVINISFTIQSLSFLFFLWIGFQQEMGVIAFPLAQLPAMLALPILQIIFCKRNSYYPTKGNWGRPSLRVFREMFHYAKDVFIIQIGNQLVNASQIIIISRFIGLGAAASYAIGTKVFTMSKMLIGTPISSVGPILTELYVRQEHSKFKKRFEEILSIGISTTAIVATGIALSNSSFIEIWTSGEISWSWHYDLLLAIILLVQSYTMNLYTLFATTKNLKAIRYTHFIEGTIFVVIAANVAAPFGIAGILIASLITHVTVTAVWFNLAAKKIIGESRPNTSQTIFLITSVIAAAALNMLMSGWGANPYHAMLANIPLLILMIPLIWKTILHDNLKCVILMKVKSFRS